VIEFKIYPVFVHGVQMWFDGSFFARRRWRYRRVRLVVDNLLDALFLAILLRVGGLPTFRLTLIGVFSFSLWLLASLPSL
jgi:hypothetical protein